MATIASGVKLATGSVTDLDEDGKVISPAETVFDQKDFEANYRLSLTEIESSFHGDFV